MRYNPRVRHCPEAECDVRVDQTEAECRSQHGCDKPTCPLRAEFGEPVDFAVSMATHRMTRH